MPSSTANAHDNDAVIVASASGEVIFSNRHPERFVGRRLSEIALELPDMFHPDGRRYEPSEWQLVRTLATGEVIVDEPCFRLAPDGSRIDYRCSSSPTYNGDGQVRTAVSVTRDVTNEEREKERLGYLAGLLDNTEDAIVALDADWHVTTWNRGAERLYGWSADEVVGRHTTEVANLELGDEERAEVRRAVAEHGRWRGDVVAYRKDGRALTIDLLTVTLRNDDDEISGFLGIHRDVSDRRSATVALEQAQRRAEEILESIIDAFSSVDHDWRYTYVNDRALAWIRARVGEQLTRDDVLGQRVWDLLPEAVGSELDLRLHAAMRERRMLAFETYYEPSDQWVEVHAFPSQNGLSIYYQDVTDRRRAREDMSRVEHRQALIAELGLRALESDDLDGLMDDAVALLARTLEIEITAVAEVLPDRRHVLLRAGAGWRPGVVGDQAEVDTSLVGYTITTEEPVVAEDIASDGRFQISSLLAGEHPVSGASVLIAGREKPFGALGAFSRERRSFSEDDLNFMQALANLLATAVERVASNARVIEVREAERRRIARALHDEALGNLSYAITQAGLARAAVADSEAADRLVDLVPVLQQVGRHLRGAIYDLRLGGEEDRPFDERLWRLVQVHQSMAGACEVRLDVRTGAPTEALGAKGTEVLRIVAEAVTNARRHSDATLICVEVAGRGAKFWVTVSDDGSGFDEAAQPATGGSGLAAMRERAEALNGELTIESVPGRGTEVRVDVPLAR